MNDTRCERRVAERRKGVKRDYGGRSQAGGLLSRERDTNIGLGCERRVDLTIGGSFLDLRSEQFTVALDWGVVPRRVICAVHV